MPAAEVVHNADDSRFELIENGTVIGIAEYRLVDGHGEAPSIAVFHHTRVTPAKRGQGNAERLVGAALDDIRARSLKVRATCWFVDQFLVEHPAYADLRA